MTQPITPMVQKVSAAIYEKMTGEPFIGPDAGPNHDLAFELARAAIEAMLEPDRMMIGAANLAAHDHFHPGKGVTEHTWVSLPVMLIVKIHRAMISAALGEKPE